MATLTDDKTDTALIPVAPASSAIAMLETMAAILEEQLWLQSQRSPHTRRAYKEDVQHFMRVFGITTSEDLRQVGRCAVFARVRNRSSDIVSGKADASLQNEDRFQYGKKPLYIHM